MLIAAIDASALGTNAIVAGVANQKYRVIAWLLTYSGTVSAKWQSASTDRTGPLYGVAGTVAQSPALPTPTRAQSPPEQFETASGEALNLTLSGAVGVGGFVIYEKVPASA